MLCSTVRYQVRRRYIERLVALWSAHYCLFFFFSSRRRHTRSYGDWSSDVCSSDLTMPLRGRVDSHLAAEELLRAGMVQVVHGPAGKEDVALGVDVVADAPQDLARILHVHVRVHRSEERRVGKECRYGWEQHREKNR